MCSSTLGSHEELPLRGDPGVEVGGYVAIPLNDAARQHAKSWTPTMHSLLEWQGRPHPVTYATSPCEPIAELPIAGSSLAFRVPRTLLLSKSPN
jgi:hypothetical protein